MMKMGVVSSFVAVACALAVASGAAAQDPQPRHLTASIGIFHYELPSRGLAPMIAIRGSTPLSSVLTLEASLAGARPGLQGGGTSTFFAPDAQLQLNLPFASLVPYLGLGVGAAVDLRDSEGGGTRTDFTISGSLGLRTWLSDALGLQFEFRGRGIGADFAGSSAEYTAGLAWRI